MFQEEETQKLKCPNNHDIYQFCFKESCKQCAPICNQEDCEYKNIHHLCQEQWRVDYSFVYQSQDVPQYKPSLFHIAQRNSINQKLQYQLKDLDTKLDDVQFKESDYQRKRLKLLKKLKKGSFKGITRSLIQSYVNAKRQHQSRYSSIPKIQNTIQQIKKDFVLYKALLLQPKESQQLIKTKNLLELLFEASEQEKMEYKFDKNNNILSRISLNQKSDFLMFYKEVSYKIKLQPKSVQKCFVIAIFQRQGVHPKPEECISKYYIGEYDPQLGEDSEFIKSKQGETIQISLRKGILTIINTTIVGFQTMRVQQKIRSKLQLRMGLLLQEVGDEIKIVNDK